MIHRDLKPSNLLVEVHDVRPVPKIIDFGIAKALGQRLTDQSLVTGLSQMVGTPLYMSPSKPVKAVWMSIRGATSIRWAWCSTNCSRATRRLKKTRYAPPVWTRCGESFGKSSHRDRVRGSARCRRPICRPFLNVVTLEPRKLSQQLHGDLDWIVMKALEKERTRRYESVSALAADVQRYLDDETVQARPPSLAHHAAKWIRRHRPLVWSRRQC